MTWLTIYVVAKTTLLMNFVCFGCCAVAGSIANVYCGGTETLAGNCNLSWVRPIYVYEQFYFQQHDFSISAFRHYSTDDARQSICNLKCDVMAFTFSLELNLRDMIWWSDGVNIEIWRFNDGNDGLASNTSYLGVRRNIINVMKWYFKYFTLHLNHRRFSIAMRLAWVSWIQHFSGVAVVELISRGDATWLMGVRVEKNHIVRITPLVGLMHFAVLQIPL